MQRGSSDSTRMTVGRIGRSRCLIVTLRTYRDRTARLAAARVAALTLMGRPRTART